MTQLNPTRSLRPTLRAPITWERSAVVASVVFAIAFVAIVATVWRAASQIDPATVLMFVT